MSMYAGRLPRITGVPPRINWARASPASSSAFSRASVPIGVIGVVAPAIP